jgi:CBS domain-containing protein
MEIRVRDVMSKRVVSMLPSDSLDAIVKKLLEYGFDGLPIVDDRKKLVGIVTQYDLVTQSSGLHLPTLEQVFKDLKVLKKDLGPLKRSFNDIHKLTAKDLMNTEPLTVGPDENLQEAAKIFVEHHRVNPVPVVDKNQKVVGILSRYDVIKLYEIQYLGETVGKAKNHAGKRADKKIERNASTLLKLMKKEFVLVSKWRSKFWYVVAGAFFLAGFLVALAWVIQITLK